MADFNSLTYLTTWPTGSNATSIRVDVTGSGYLLSIGNLSGTTPNNISFQIDGGSITRAGLEAYQAHSLMLRFNSRLIVRSDTDLGCIYVLD